MIKVTTRSGTVLLVDEESQRFMRILPEGHDNPFTQHVPASRWMGFIDHGPIEIGEVVWFNINSHPSVPWYQSSSVVKIEEV